jgi:hypothetical protein
MSKIVWIKFEAWHGPGHQSHTIEYIPYDYELSDDDLQCELEGWSQQFNNVSSEADWIDELPAEVRTTKQGQYLRKLKHAQRVLASLGIDPPKHKGGGEV